MLTADYQAYETYLSGIYRDINPAIVLNVLIYQLFLAEGGTGGSESPPSAPTNNNVDDTTFVQLSAQSLTRQGVLLTNKSDTNDLLVNFVIDVTQANWVYKLKPGQTLEMNQITHPRFIYARITILAASGSCDYSFMES